MPKGIYQRTEQNTAKSRASHRTVDYHIKTSLIHMGHPVSKETGRKISIANKGKPSPLKGKTYIEIYGDRAQEKLEQNRRNVKLYQNLPEVKRAKSWRQLKLHIPREELENLYLIQRLSMRKIGKLFNVTADRVFNLLNFYAIPHRTMSEALRGRTIYWASKIGRKDNNRKFKITKEKLDNLYQVNDLTIYEIGSMYNVGGQTVLNALNYYNIPVKPPGKTLSKLNKDPEFIRKRFKGIRRKPTKPEIKLGELIEMLYPNEYKYVGDGEVTLGQFNPDYINVNGKKKIIEMFGDYYHKGENPQVKIDKYAEFGFDCLVIWEHELKDEQAVTAKIKAFDAP